MRREDVLNSISLKKRFCKDNNLPVAVYDNPYFMQRLSVFNLLKPCTYMWDNFCNEMKKYKNEQDYFEYYNNVKENAINFIKENAAYQRFNEEVINTKTSFPKKNLYIEDNDGYTFLSIDMRKANFSALHTYSSEIFDNCKTWEEFIGMFTDSKHIINSKYIRQVIMGACNPKRQIQYEKYIMNNVLVDLLKALPEYEVFSLGEDEIILKLPIGDDMIYHKNIVNDYLRSTELFDILNVTVFRLEKIKGTDGYIKYIAIDESKKQVSFKCLNAEIYHQVVLYFFNSEELIQESDLVFYHDGKLARFLKPIDNPFRKEE